MILESIFDSQLQVKELTTQLKVFNQQYREFIKKYTQITQIPVEPIELSPLIDKISAIQGVCYCLCPGSGGYDAIFVLGMAESIEIRGQIEE